MPTHLILCAHGSSRPQAVGPLLALCQAAKNRFAGVDCRPATLSGHGHGKTQSQTGLALPAALAELRGKGKVAVQSLHVLPGEAHARLCGLVNESGIDDHCACIGPCLMQHADEAPALARALAAELRFDQDNEAVVMAAHVQGANLSPLLSALATALWRHSPRIFLTAIPSVGDEAAPADPPHDEATDQPGFLASPEQLLAALGRIRAEKITVIPLLTLAGRHALHDVAGDAPHALSSRLRRAGYEVANDTKGLLERPEVTELWLGKAAVVLAELSGL